MKVLDRTEVNGTGNCIITLKDHKINFINHPTTRLINPANNETGRISKEILDRINSLVCSNLKVNEWKNTSSVITWSRNIKDKHLYKFLIFDIKDFYPSIEESLFHEALQFAKMHVNITQRDIEVMFHSRKTLLYNNGIPWVKKEGTGFNVTIGAYDGAEICELIGIFMLPLQGTNYDSENIGWYRDDGSSIFRKVSGPDLEKIKKYIQKIFKKKVLDVIIEGSTKIVNYLDVTCNLNDGKYKPYKKPNDETKYIHVDSEHPPSIIKQIPRSIATRLFSL